MTHDLAEALPWPTRRWYVLTAFIFALQLSLIFWLGRPQRRVASVRDIAPSIQLAGTNAPAFLALNDPTLFALPHQEGFSGLAWLKVPEQEFGPFLWEEGPPLLDLDHQRLGNDFQTFMATREASALPVFADPELKLMSPSVEPEQPLVTQSTLRLMGELASRHLVVAPTLQSWPSAEILSNSVVQLLVGADGIPISARLLTSPGSASTEADQQALRDASHVRFDPIRTTDLLDAQAGLALGQMVFQWHTIPLPATNTSSTGAAPK